MSLFDIPKDKIQSMQQVGLQMALYFDAFCQEHGLEYFLCGGCCIATQRGGHFIPWDDDVDVFMPRADYEKLKKLWVDTEEYSIQYTTKDFLTENQFLTICANNTTFIKTYQKELDINHGVVLDVLPLDGCPTGWKRKMQKIWALLYALFIVGKAPTNHGAILNFGSKVLLMLVKPKAWRYAAWRLCEKKMTQYPIEECDFITELCSGPRYMQNEYPKEFFSSAIRVPFEGHLMPIPVGYDGYLKMAFGDYMQLPPVEKQVCHHEYEFMDMENSYTNYRGVYYCVGQKERKE